jgi:hypothetical protein
VYYVKWKIGVSQGNARVVRSLKTVPGLLHRICIDPFRGAGGQVDQARQQRDVIDVSEYRYEIRYRFMRLAQSSSRSMMFMTFTATASVHHFRPAAIASPIVGEVKILAIQ